jgi:hypothetical protein
VIPPNPGTTRIEREHFLLHAPFQWMAVPAEDSAANPLEFEFRNKTLPEQLIVTVLLARAPFDERTRRSVAEDLVTKRLKALAQISNGHAVHSPVDYRSGSGQVEARCVAVDEPQRVRSAFVVRVAPAKVVTVALTRYFLEEVGGPFDMAAGLIFDMLQVKSPDTPPPT